MANEKNDKSKKDDKQDKAPETAMAKVEPVQTELVMGGMPRLPFAVPSEAQIAVLAQTAVMKLEALHALLLDPSLAPEGKAAVQTLMELTDPNKPGMEEMNTRWKIPRVMICQPTTTHQAKPESAKNGDLFTTEGELLEKPFTYYPLWFNEENIMFETGETAPICMAPDAKLGQKFGECAKCPNLPFGKQNGGRGDQKATDCNNQIVVTVLSADLQHVYTIQFAKTSRKAGGALMALAGASKFPWAKAYQLTTEKGDSTKGVYYKAKTEPTGKACSEDIKKIGYALCELYGANRKLMLGEYYGRIGAAGLAALSAEAAGIDHDAIAAGLGGEPDLSAPANAPAVRGSSKPM